MSNESDLMDLFFINFDKAQKRDDNDKRKDTSFQMVNNFIMYHSDSIISYTLDKINERNAEHTHTLADGAFIISIMEYVSNKQKEAKDENEELLKSIEIMIKNYTNVAKLGILAARQEKTTNLIKKQKIEEIQKIYENTIRTYESFEPVIKYLVHASNETMDIAVNTIREYLIDYAEKRKITRVASASASAAAASAAAAKSLVARGKQSRRTKQSRRKTK